MYNRVETEHYFVLHQKCESSLVYTRVEAEQSSKEQISKDGTQRRDWYVTVERLSNWLLSGRYKQRSQRVV
jgi:hypothetical protein